MPAPSRPVTGFPQPWHSLCLAASRLLLRAFSIALASAAAFLALHTAAAGVSHVVNGVATHAGLRSPGDRSWAPTSSSREVLPPLIPVFRAPCQDSSQPATRGITWSPSDFPVPRQ